MRGLWRAMGSRAERLALVGHADAGPPGEAGKEAHGRRGTGDPDFNLWAEFLVGSTPKGVEGRHTPVGEGANYR